METANLGNGTRYYVMAVTTTRLYSFTGIGSLEVRLSPFCAQLLFTMEVIGHLLFFLIG